MSTCHLYILINNFRIIPSDSQILTKRGRNKTIVVMVDPSCIQFYLYLSWTVVCVRKLTQLCSTPVGFSSIFHIIVPFLPQRGTQNCLIILCSILVEHCFQWAFSLNKVALRVNLPCFSVAEATLEIALSLMGVVMLNRRCGYVRKGVVMLRMVWLC